MTCQCVKSISGAVVEQTVRPGGNITLHCDLETDLIEVEWHCKCPHAKQPAITISVKYPQPHFSVTQNSSTKSIDLRIVNITEDDLGLYYCSGFNVTDVTAREVRSDTIFKVFFEGR